MTVSVSHLTSFIRSILNWPSKTKNAELLREIAETRKDLKETRDKLTQPKAKLTATFWHPKRFDRTK